MHTAWSRSKPKLRTSSIREFWSCLNFYPSLEVPSIGLWSNMECHSFFPFLVDHVEIDRADSRLSALFLRARSAAGQMLIFRAVRYPVCLSARLSHLSPPLVNVYE